MKKYILFIAYFCLCCTACTEDMSVDPTVMPEATTTGQETFGCLVDGWIYAGGRYYWTDISIKGIYSGSISFTYVESLDEIHASVVVGPIQSIGFKIQHPEEGEETTYTDAWFGQEELEDGKVTITRFDKKNKIISGRFEGGRMTQGRFDARYKQ